ncbi:MAG: hypothetical protein FJW37_07410 [Acidobacteria bacterium]|nr:hypothetical protein [Acidobacteriota bacterium]
MDAQFGDIAIALYRQAGAAGPVYRVHTYSGRAGAPERMRRVADAMQTLGGMERVSGVELRFPCGAAHQAAVRRVFLEAVKLAADSPLEARPLAVLDKKSQKQAEVRALGPGAYQVSVEGDPARAAAIAHGLAKLGEMQRDPAEESRVTFDCGRAHDALAGLLLPRALNVRAVIRDEEMAAARGVLVAPSAQK